MNLFETLATDSTDFAKRNGYFQDEAVRKPVVVQKHGRPKTVLIAYDEFVRLRDRDRQVFTIENLPDDIARSILEATVPDELE